jgi:hypothetical protein
MSAISSGTRRRVRPLLALTLSAALATAVVGSTAVPSAAASTSKNDPGIGSAAALAGPNCDPTTKRIKFQSPYAPPCVKPWNAGDDNGGATAQGVTKDSIKVVVLWAELTGALERNVPNRSNGQVGTEPDAMMDMDAAFKPFFQTWGRTVEYTFVKGTGTDEAAQRADAVKVAALKPYAVVDFAGTYLHSGGLVFESALRDKVPVLVTFPCCGVIPAKARSNPLVENAAEWTGKALVGGKAKWSGDDSTKSKTRVFGVIYPAGSSGIDYGLFQRGFAKYGGRVASAASYPTTTDQLHPPPEAAEQAPTIITKLKAAGVTTIVNFADGLTMTPALMKAATDQSYFPEWVVTGNGYQDIDVIASLLDKQQASHMFGLVWFNPVIPSQDPALATPFDWYWGPDKATFAGAALSLAQALYTGVHLAGPDLTAKTFEQALVDRYPPTGGAFSNQVTTYENAWATFGSPSPRGSALAWWNPDVTGPSQVNGVGTVTGKYMFLDGGKRYSTGHFPKGEPKFFDRSASDWKVDPLPPSDQMPVYPCNDCPSSGGGPAPSVNAGV